MMAISLDGRCVGRTEGSVLKKQIIFEEHALRVPPALAFDVRAIAIAKQRGCDRIIVTDENGKRYCAMMVTLDAKGFKLNRGHGEQVALTMTHWKDNIIMAERHAEGIAHE